MSKVILRRLERYYILFDDGEGKGGRSDIVRRNFTHSQAGDFFLMVQSCVLFT